LLLSLIGISGSGKSYWSEKLARHGFRRFCIDALIVEKLSAHLRREDGSSLTLGEWMGFPFQDGYHEKERLYLSHEKQLMAETIDWIDKNASARCSRRLSPPRPQAEPAANMAGGPAARPQAAGNENVVVDTTGSVIYTGDDLLKSLRALTTVVYFPVPSVIREAMLRQYLLNPRPVLWRGFFGIAPGESVDTALFRSYNGLLDSREVLYRKLAHVEIDFFRRNSPDFKISDFLEIAGASGK
jgi:hypothetical protein